MILKLLKSSVLGRAGVLINMSESRADELIRAGLAEEYSIARDYERKVVHPEVKEQTKPSKKLKLPKKD